ncbi:hypothetical protein EVG20_g5055 [Dentipellis fragilis]|uniref:DUF6589 domain-containing protein n=1 Tax=Dentipellis fragilis TaxID=205917 RepID=A0A4Y9YY26_9AGAM|nr:hypothetical protein EVG20_g5055 [Dentipellis fragilis]
MESLTSLDFSVLSQQLQSSQGCPALWSILRHAGWSKEQAICNSHKTPENVIMNILSMLSYTRFHRHHCLPMLWSIYLKSCSLSARAFDALHAIGLLMSYKWTTIAYSNIAKTAEHAAQEAVRNHATFISHDNLNIPKRVFSMRLDNQSHFHSACAGTLWVLPDHITFPKTLNWELRETRREGSKTQYNFTEILDPNPAQHQRLRDQGVYRILRFLLESPAFVNYQERDDAVLSPPPPVNLLPCGPTHTIKQFILCTADIDEASYEGNEKRKETSINRLIPIVGDQLTVERLRGLAKYRHDDINGLERLDWLVTVNGFFHLEIAFANSLHKQYVGTSGGIGLHRAFNLLNRKGLLSTQVKGPFWHHLDEALAHIAEAHFRALWMIVGKAARLEDLLWQPPEALVLLAETIYDEYASRRALRMMQHRGEKDEFKHQSILFNSDILLYLDLHEATCMGDVGCLEDLFPYLLMRFAGGGNNKYMIEMLEIFQGLHKEWPESLKYIIRNHCWLINRTGKRNGFVPVDRAQEQNIKDLKVTYHSFGRSATLAYLTKILPAIPVLREVKKHIKWQLDTLLTRGDRHSSPAKEKDVAMYAEVILNEGWYTYEAGHTLKKSDDRAKDFVTQGTITLFQDKAIERWWNGRSFARVTQEKWLEEQ